MVDKTDETRLAALQVKSQPAIGREIAGQVYRLEREHLAAKLSALCGLEPEPAPIEYSPAQQLYVDERERTRPRATPESRARKLCDIYEMIERKPQDYDAILAEVRRDWNEAIHG